MVYLRKDGHPVRLAWLRLSFTIVLVVAALGVSVAACSGGADDVTTTLLETSSTSTTTTAMTTTSGPVTSSTSMSEPTTVTTCAGPNQWERVSTSLAELAAQLAQRLPEGQSVGLPDRLPVGWSVSMSGQVYGDAVAGYFADITENPATAINDGVDQPFGEYRVVFTDGKELVGVMMVLGDWGETEFQEVTAYGRTLLVYQDENIIVALTPGWDFGTVVGSPGAREAVLEMAASIQSW